MSYLYTYISIGVVVYIVASFLNWYYGNDILIKDIFPGFFGSFLLWPITLNSIIENVFEEKALIKGRKKKEKR